MKIYLTKIKYLFSNFSIQSKLLLSFALLIIVPLYLLAGQILGRTGDVIRKESRSSLEFSTYQTATNIDLLLGKVKDAVFSIQSDSAVQSILTTIDSPSYLDVFQERYYKGELTNALFRLTYADEVEYVRIVSKVGIYAELDKAVFKESVTAVDLDKMNTGLGGVVWFGYHPSTDTILLAAVINSISTQQPLGYLVMNMRQPPLEKLFSQMMFKENGDLFIMDENSRFISYNKEIVSLNVPEGYLAQMDRTAASGFYVTVDASVVYHRLANAPWYVVARVSTQEIELPLARLYATIIIIVIMIAIASLFLATIFSKTISSPIKKLTVAMGKFSEGDLDIQCDIPSTNEIGQLSLRFNEMVKNINMLIQKNYSETLSKQQAELKSLRMQVNPHFIYNTLETINWMARSNKVPEIGEVAKSLGDLMRSTISGSDFITIENEMNSVKNYLTIQRYRYGDRLDIRQVVSAELNPMYIPKMVIQPILENAILHGIGNSTDGGEIQLSGLMNGTDVIIRIRDNGVGIPDEKLRQLFDPDYNIDEDEHTHIGISNVDTRLKMYYGSQYGITIWSEENKGTEVILRFPGQLSPPEI